MIIIDNTAGAFAFQVNNGVPIVPFINNKNDRELLQLIPFLRSLKDKNVQQTLKETFHLDKFEDCHY